MKNKGWKLVEKGKASEEAGRIRRVDRERGMTKIRLIVLVCVICLVIGWFYYLIIQQEQQGIKAKMSEVTHSMSNVASAVAAYHQEENTWPHCDGVIAIQDSLGVIFRKETTDRISSITVTSPRAEEVIITATIKGIDSRVDGKNLTLTGKPSERDILWVWGGTVPSPYVLKNNFISKAAKTGKKLSLDDSILSKYEFRLLIVKALHGTSTH